MLGFELSASKLPSTMDIVIHAYYGQLIKARIMQTGKSYMNSQLVQQLRKERYATGVNITSEPLNVQEVGFVVEGLSVERLAQVNGLSHLVTGPILSVVMYRKIWGKNFPENYFGKNNFPHLRSST